MPATFHCNTDDVSFNSINDGRFMRSLCRFLFQHTGYKSKHQSNSLLTIEAGKWTKICIYFNLPCLLRSKLQHHLQLSCINEAKSFRSSPTLFFFETNFPPLRQSLFPLTSARFNANSLRLVLKKKLEVSTQKYGEMSSTFDLPLYSFFKVFRSILSRIIIRRTWKWFPNRKEDLKILAEEESYERREFYGVWPQISASLS